MDAAGGDVGGDQHGGLAGAELLQGAGALRLGLAAVQRRGPYALRQQVLGEPVGAALGVHEHDHAAVAGGDLGRGGPLVGVVHVQDVVLHRGDRRGRRVHGVGDRVGQEAAHELVDVAVQRRGEQHPLAVRVHLLHQAGDLRQEAHVGHLVGLVEDGDGDLVELAGAAVQQVGEPPRGGDQDLGALAQRVDLAVDRGAADDRGRTQTDRGGVRGERLGDLGGQLTGGHEHHREGALALGAASRRTAEHRQSEGQGLAGAGPAAAEDVPAREGGGQRRGLDGERLGDALRTQRGEKGRCQRQLVEGDDGRLGGRPRGRLGCGALSRCGRSGH